MNSKFRIFCLSFFIIIIAFSAILTALTVREIFYDGFEANDFATVWTSNAKFSRSTVTVDSGTYAILADGGTANVLMTLTNGLNISNQTYCNLTSRLQIHANLDGNEYLCMDYSTDGGTTWNINAGSDGAAGGLCQDGNLDTETAWRTVQYDILNASGINSFKVRFRLSTNNANEDGYIDNVNLTCYSNIQPTIDNVSASATTIKGGDTITIYANTSSHGVNDTEADTLQLFCDTTNAPTSVNTDCTGGTTSDSTYPYTLTCTFATPITDAFNTEYCRVYDGISYSSISASVNYTTDSTAPTTSLVSVAGDSLPSYIDNINDGRTDIIVSGESGMLCRWGTSDVVYASMTNDCTISGVLANCSVNDVALQGYATRYVSCEDNLTNSQNITSNLDIQFVLDYTAPTTTDTSVSTVQVPGYNFTIIEADNVDSDPTTYYCTSSVVGCNPTTSINNGSSISYSSANRGANYLRYYSIDFAGNTQVVVNKTININRLPIFSSASDDAEIIRGGTIVNVSSVSYDLDSGQELKLYVCNSNSANSTGCVDGHYCNSSALGNVSCTFAAENDSSSHTWYAFLFDELGEAATTNSFSGSYTTDYSSPVITLLSPTNGSTITQNSLTFSIVVNEALTNAWYYINNNANVSLSNTTLLSYSSTNSSIADGSYNFSIWANDSYGNIASLSGLSFTINTAVPDTTPPTITLHSPTNGTYYISADLVLNLTSDEILSSAWYSVDGGANTTLLNISSTNWNSTTTLAEGQHNFTFYANDTSNNIASSSAQIYTDLTNPSVSAFSCTDKNDSISVVCSANVTDVIRLDYAIIGYNATGVWKNSSQITLSGTSDSLSYTISAGNTTPPGFTAQIYLYDYSGRNNLTESDFVNIYDDIFPTIFNISYIPNTTEGLDPSVDILINASIVEDYNISSVVLLYRNASASNWSSITMANTSDLVERAASNINYNATLNLPSETWYFKINATDTAGNENISSNYTLVIANDTTFFNSTTIADITSFTYAQRAENNTLGQIYLNNTGDYMLNFSIILTSSIASRFNINYTNNYSQNYSASTADIKNLTLLVNTTSLTSGFYPYNITINSLAGTTLLQKQLNIQTSAGPYLDVSIDSYSSSVTKGQTGIVFEASVSNLGTSSAENVTLSWTLPSEFSITSGSSSRFFSTLAIGESGSNSITISVSSSSADKIINVSATATSDNADSANESKQVTIGSPTTVEVVTTGGGGSGGGGGGGAAVSPAIQYIKTVEVVTGSENSFEVEVYNKYLNSSLKDVTLNIFGYPSQYIDISPKKIDFIGSKQTQKFKVTLKSPGYKTFEEYSLKVNINGLLVSGTSTQKYYELQNIKLLLQEVSRSDSELELSLAEKAILEMKEKGFNIKNSEKLLFEAKQILSQNKNKESYDLSKEILALRDRSFFVSDLILRIQQAMDDPKKTSLITGNVAKEFLDEQGNLIYSRSLLTGNAIFSSSSSEELLNLAISAFERGDYSTAEERAKNAQVLLILERKGNFGLFLYLYWEFVLIGVFLLTIFGMMGFRVYQKSNINQTIKSLNKKETKIREDILEDQKQYFTGKISSSEYHRIMNQHQSDIAKIKSKRIELGNKRISLLKPEEIKSELNKELGDIEKEIKKLQERYYKDRKISEQEYKMQFETLNERLSEIEGERTSLHISEHKKGEKK